MSNFNKIDKNKLKKAKERVKSIRGFYVHLFVFLFVNFTLIVINLLTSPDKLWFRYAAFGWGIGLFFNFLAVFFWPRKWIFSREWEKKKIEEILETEID